MPMQHFSYIIIFLLIFSCNSKQEIPDIVYKKGDFWVDNFRTNSFPAKIIVDDKLYCTSIDVGGVNYLYCLNLKTGMVDWATKIEDWASVPPIVKDSFIYYSSFVGDIYKFDKGGNKQWQTKLNGSFAGFAINPTTNNLYVGTVQNGIIEYDFNSGKEVRIYGRRRLGVTLPVFENNKMYIAGISADSNNSGKSLLAIDNKGVSLTLKKEIGNYVDRIFVRKKLVFYVDELYRLNCLNSFNGDSIWQTKQLSNNDGFMTRNPHLVFLDTSLLYYDSDLNHLKVINLNNGSVVIENNYEELIKSGILKSDKREYKIINKKKKFIVRVINKLPETLESEMVDIEIIVSNNS